MNSAREVRGVLGAITLLHEMGHVYNTVMARAEGGAYLLLGGSAISDDRRSGTHPSQSLRNQDLVFDNCFAPMLDLPRRGGRF